MDVFEAVGKVANGEMSQDEAPGDGAGSLSNGWRLLRPVDRQHDGGGIGSHGPRASRDGVHAGNLATAFGTRHEILAKPCCG